MIEPMSDPYTEAKRQRDTYVPTPPADPQSEKSLREKLRNRLTSVHAWRGGSDNLSLRGAVIEENVTTVLDVFREHFDSKRDAIRQAQERWERTEVDDLVGEIRSILFGEDA